VVVVKNFDMLSIMREEGTPPTRGSEFAVAKLRPLHLLDIHAARGGLRFFLSIA